MNTQNVVNLIVEKGLASVNISMFSDKNRCAILEGVARRYIEADRIGDLLSILDDIDCTKFSKYLQGLAEQFVEIGDFSKASRLYQKCGKVELAELIDKNFT